MESKKDRIIGFPEFDLYSQHFVNLFRRMNLKTLDTIPITSNTINLGVRYSPEMMCFPYKVVLGNFIELLDKGANTLVMYSTCGKCKYRHYYKLVTEKLRKEGYTFEMIKLTSNDLIPVPLPRFMNQLKYLSGVNKLKLAKIVYEGWKEIGLLEKTNNKKEGSINIGITGEIYCVLDKQINHNIKEQLEKLGAVVHITLSIREVITKNFWTDKERKRLRKECWNYLDEGEDIGGHGLHTIEDTLLWKEKNIDGIIHITPLTCHPEVLVEDAVDYICNSSNIPLLRIKIDETSSSLNIATRIETFFELIKRRKKMEVIECHLKLG